MLNDLMCPYASHDHCVWHQGKRDSKGETEKRKGTLVLGVSVVMRSWIIIGNTSKKRCGYVVACGDEPTVAWTVA